MRRIYFLLFFVFATIPLFSQYNPKIDSKTFFVHEEGVERAKMNLKNAESFYQKGKGTYDEALKYYLNLAKYNNKSHALNYKIGVCYLWTSNKKAALPYLLQSSPEIATDYYLILGRSYQYNNEYDKAKQAYTDYIASLPKWKQNDEQRFIDQFILECETSSKIIADSVPVFVKNLGPVINSYYDDYNAFLPDYDSIIYFTTKRPKQEPKTRVSRFKFKERVFISDNCIHQPSQWVTELPRIDGKSNISLAGMGQVNKRIFFYQGRVHSGRLFTAVYKDGKWKKIKTVKGINHIAYKETTISITDSADAYFVTNKRGGEGGMDIWVAKYKKKHRFHKPVNVGETINTPFDEEGVHVTRDGKTLYFSSKGHSGMGGFDVYQSTLQLDGTWGEPKNMGHPINSPADELFYRPTNDPMVALYSTIREDSYGGLDIYKIENDPRIPFTIMGSVNDIETGDDLPAFVSGYDYKNKVVLQTVPVDTLSGMYKMSFEDIGDYSMQINMAGYKTLTDTLECPKTRHATIIEDYKMEVLRHPFTLSGNITDMDKLFPLFTTLTFLNAADSTVLGRARSDSAMGKYQIQFDDKYDLIIEVECEDYFSISEPIATTGITASVISKDIQLKRSKIEYTLTGRIANEEGTKPVYAAISFYRPGEIDPFQIVISDSTNGKYTAVISEPGPFLLELEANAYFFYNETYQFPEGQTFTAKNFDLKAMDVGAKIVVENILFTSGKSTLKPESFPELDKLASLLQKNAKIRIEVSGHTDNVGSASINKRISKSRALTVKNYLVSRGILQDRIEYQGYGFDQPIVPNDTPEGRSRNRRVEIKVLN